MDTERIQYAVCLVNGHRFDPAIEVPAAYRLQCFEKKSTARDFSPLVASLLCNCSLPEKIGQMEGRINPHFRLF